MMRAAYFLPLLVAACAQQPSAPSAPSAGGPCNAASAQFAVGQAYSDALGEEARQRSGARVMRTLRPNQAVTLEFNGERLNLQLDAVGQVAAARCG
jgi:hypothetical protein